MKKLTQTQLKERLNYNKKSGVFTWLKAKGHHYSHTKNPIKSSNIFNSKYLGKEAGSIATSTRSKTSYLSIKICGKSYKAHRLAFLYEVGEMPKEVDHLDHNGLNNKWENLRASNSFDNSKNLPKQKSNKTGVIGVNWHKAAKKWQSRAVNNKGERIDLGRFDSFDDAVKARIEAEKQFCYFEHRGDIHV